MTIDFRVAIDWQDNGHINWLQDATSESDPLNILTDASFSAYTLTLATLTATSSNYGLNFVTTTSLPTVTEIGDAAAVLGEIVVSPNTTYTAAMWLQKISASDGARSLQMRVIETASTAGLLATRSGSIVADNNTTLNLHSVTFTTTASTTRIFIQVFDPTSGVWVDEVNCYGLMVVAGSTVPSTFNDGAIKVLTHRTVEARWNIGYKTSIVNGSVANENRLECSLYNLDDYITAAKYQDVHRVYIEGSDDGGSNWTRLYTGWTRTWFPIFDTNNPDLHLKFTGVSSRFYLDGVKSRLAVQESKTMKQVAQAILDEVELPDGNSLTISSADGSTFGYAGQNWTEEVDLLRALADTVGGDGYILWFDRSDTPTTLALTNLTNTNPLSSDFGMSTYVRATADYRYADPWYNMIEMKVSPRKLSATNTNRLWRLPADYSIPANDTVTMLARYNDDDKPYQIGARDVSYDNAVFSSGSPTITLTAKSTSCYIDIDNTGGSATTLTDLRIIGQKVKTWDSYYEQLYLSTAVTTNGNNTKQLNYDITDDIDRAVNIMQNWLDIFGEKSHRLWSIITPGTRDDSTILDYRVGHYGNFLYPDGTSYKHTVIGEEWAWRKDGSYEKRWYLEKHDSAFETPGRVPSS